MLSVPLAADVASPETRTAAQEPPTCFGMSCCSTHGTCSWASALVAVTAGTAVVVIERRRRRKGGSAAW